MRELELRYVVLKLSDIDRLEEHNKDLLWSLTRRVALLRHQAGKEPLEACVVVEKDWPEYEQIRNLILKNDEEVELNRDNVVAVDPSYKWRSLHTCPRGVKVQLLTKGGIAIYGVYRGETDGTFQKWAPLPTN